MADIQLTDDLGKSAPDVKIDLSQLSSLLKYAKTELLHLVVAPDFIERASQPLTVAQEILGHSHLSTTADLYLRVDQHAMVTALERVKALSDHFKSGQRLSLQNRPTGLAVQD